MQKKVRKDEISRVNYIIWVLTTSKSIFLATKKDKIWIKGSALIFFGVTFGMLFNHEVKDKPMFHNVKNENQHIKSKRVANNKQYRKHQMTRTMFENMANARQRRN